MKKLTFLLAAGNLFLMLSCGKTEKQPGEEYYDPDYKPQTTQPVAQAGNDDNTTSAAPVAGNASDSGSTEAATTTPGPQVTTAQPSGTKVEGAPADKDEVEVAVVPKDKLQASPAGKSFDKGKTLISKSDCLACHQDNAKLVGPAY
ncbi:MAG: hypothetical protein JWQ14_3548, partial [Adhaeribacter sp.]|nr:hypothetical protein [Adhaeribacter sp.]